jgi:hypothetical protein
MNLSEVVTFKFRKVHAHNRGHLVMCILKCKCYIHGGDEMVIMCIVTCWMGT